MQAKVLSDNRRWMNTSGNCGREEEGKSLSKGVTGRSGAYECLRVVDIIGRHDQATGLALLRYAEGFG